MTAPLRRITESRFVRDDLRAALAPWIVSRVLVIASLWGARYLVDQLEAPRRLPLLQGLFGWDATFYRLIAEHGYDAIGRESLRFFPLVPMLSRGLGVVFLGNDALALLVVVNISALLFAATAHRIVLRETADPAAATRAAWFALVVPPALTLVMGYAEATFLALVAGAFLAYRSQRWGWAAVAGLLAGLCRPLGLLLILPATIEAWRHRNEFRPSSVLAEVAPGVGTLVFLIWSAAAGDGFWSPFSVQSGAAFRGDVVNPAARTARAVRLFFEGDRFDSGRQLAWLALFVILLVVMARRLPVSYTAFGVATVLVTMSADNIQSLERYGMSGLILVLGLPLVTGNRDIERAALTYAAGGLVVYSVLAFAGVLVP